MANFGEIILGALTGVLSNVGESKLKEVLQTLHDKDVVQYEAAVKGGHALVLALLPVVAKTGTKIDDAIINALDEAIKESASENNIEL